MKKLLLLLLLLPAFANGQFYPDTTLHIYYPNDTVFDSTTFTFASGDSLSRNFIYISYSYDYPPDTALIQIDTSSSTIWQIGNTLKTVFSNDTVASHGIMTDTLNPYPANANDYFVMTMGYMPNVIIDIWHKYQMGSLHAGGIVEFSTDNGATWMNVAYCNQIDTQNFYSQADTIISGQPAFTGNSHGEQLSRLQFMTCMLIGSRVSATSCFSKFSYWGGISLRFRFVSDSTVDSLSGWMIDSIRIENPGCLLIPGYIKTVANQNTIFIFPNPAYDNITITSSAEEITRVEITDMLGRQVYSKAQAGGLTSQVDVAGLPGGVYFVKVNNTDPSTGLRMTGKFVKE